MARLGIVLVGLLLAGRAAAWEPVGAEGAPAPSAPSLAEAHDGPYVHLAAGLGVGHQSNPGGQEAFRASSSGRSLTLAVGGAMRRNLLLGVRFMAAWPLGGVGLGSRWSSSWGMRALAADCTWYVGPRNTYLGVAPALTSLTMQLSGDRFTGAGLRLASGREWWVSDNWGIGLAFEYLGSLNRVRREDGSARPVASHWFGLALSATYN